MMNFFALPDGRRLAWREKGIGDPLVLLHGWSMSSVVFSEALETLSNNFRVLVPDLRGHGDSDPGDGYGLDNFVEDLKLWIDSLGLQFFQLLGWSMGGQIALKLCGANPDRVKQLILVDSTPRFVAGNNWAHGLPDAQIEAMSRSLKGDYLTTMGNFFALMFTGENLSDDRHHQLAKMTAHAGCLPKPEVALASLETLRNSDLRTHLKNITCPTLIMHGDQDAIILPSAGQYLSENIADARLFMCPGISHAPFLSHPEEVFKTWREFLS